MISEGETWLAHVNSRATAAATMAASAVSAWFRGRGSEAVSAWFRGRVNAGHQHMQRKRNRK